MKDMAQTERQIFILLLLSENKNGYTIAELQEKLANWDEPVDKKTIGRDIDSLSQICFISEEKRNGKTYYLADKFKLNPVTFTSTELSGMAFIHELLQPYKYSTIGKSALSFMEKIISNTSNLNSEFVKYFRGFVSLNTNSYGKDININPIIEEVLNTAIKDKKKVTITYRSFSSDQDTNRTICPYELLISEGFLSVMAYCELRESVREFRLSRIKDIILTDTPFVVNDQYIKELKQKKFIHMSGDNNVQVVIHFNQAMSKYIKEYEYQKADKIIDDNNGILFHRNTGITDELVSWILKFGPGATVIEPKELKDKVYSQLKMALINYNNNEAYENE